MIAGPSEIVVIADEKNNSRWVASDLMAQAEHDINAQSILITNNSSFADKVLNNITNLIVNLPKKKIITKSLNKNGLIILVKDISDSIEIINSIAPEHLHIHTDKNGKFIENIHNAGCIKLAETHSGICRLSAHGRRTHRKGRQRESGLGLSPIGVENGSGFREAGGSAAEARSDMSVPHVKVGADLPEAKRACGKGSANPRLENEIQNVSHKMAYDVGLCPVTSQKLSRQNDLRQVSSRSASRNVVPSNVGKVGASPPLTKDKYTLSQSNNVVVPPVDNDNVGFGIAYIEAAQYGVPSLGGVDGGAADAIQHDKTGLICDGNNLDEIYSSLNSMIENKKYLHFGKNAKELSSKFDWSSTIEQYKKILN